MTKERAFERGWGSLVTVGYPDILNYLENQLNNPFKKVESSSKKQNQQNMDEYEATDEWKKIVDSGTEETAEILQQWGSQQLVQLLNLDKHTDLADYAFPVFACGYNWLESNMDSADYVADRLNNQVMKQVKKEFSTLKFKKFIN